MQLKTEKDIKVLLNLDIFIKQYSSPLFGQQAFMIRIDSVDYSYELFENALSKINNESLKLLMEYKGDILIHNNLGGYAGSGTTKKLKDSLIKQGKMSNKLITL